MSDDADAAVLAGEDQDYFQRYPRGCAGAFPRLEAPAAHFL